MYIIVDKKLYNSFVGEGCFFFCYRFMDIILTINRNEKRHKIVIQYFLETGDVQRAISQVCAD